MHKNEQNPHKFPCRALTDPASWMCDLYCVGHLPSFRTHSEEQPIPQRMLIALSFSATHETTVESSVVSVVGWVETIGLGIAKLIVGNNCERRKY